MGLFNVFYFVGEALLIKPVTHQGAISVDVYFPGGATTVSLYFSFSFEEEIQLLICCCKLTALFVGHEILLYYYRGGMMLKCSSATMEDKRRRLTHRYPRYRFTRH